jgi:hypothetical protein
MEENQCLLLDDASMLTDGHASLIDTRTAGELLTHVAYLQKM